MSNDTLVAETRASLERWHSITPPNDLAIAMVADLEQVILGIGQFRGRLKMEEEPASFMTALIEAAELEVAA